MNFTQEIVSKLGTKSEPLGWAEIAGLIFDFLVIVAVGVGTEFVIGRLLRRVFARVWRDIRSDFDHANTPDRNDR
jgi:hypothetical protein